MKKHYSPSQIAQCCLEYKRGLSVQELMEKYQIPRSTLYYWFKKYNDLPKNNQIKLTHVCEILQKVNCTASAPLKTRLYELEKLYGEYSVHELCSALNVSRGTFYN
ncbi:MAG: helix-turn-helix domain-containing protein, partial [Clostridia bacterium]|nr:helix-turn-helix domain-containing protein [Clostridia bacterium]